MTFLITHRLLRFISFTFILPKILVASFSHLRLNLYFTQLEHWMPPAVDAGAFAPSAPPLHATDAVTPYHVFVIVIAIKDLYSAIYIRSALEPGQCFTDKYESFQVLAELIRR